MSTATRRHSCVSQLVASAVAPGGGGGGVRRVIKRPRRVISSKFKDLSDVQRSAIGRITATVIKEPKSESAAFKHKHEKLKPNVSAFYRNNLHTSLRTSNKETKSAGDAPLSRRSDNFNIPGNTKVSNRIYHTKPQTSDHAKWYIESDRAKKYAPNMSVKPQKYYKCGTTMEADRMLSKNAKEKNIQKSDRKKHIKLKINTYEKNALNSEEGSSTSTVQEKNRKLQDVFRKNNFKTSSDLPNVQRSAIRRVISTIRPIIKEPKSESAGFKHKDEKLKLNISAFYRNNLHNSLRASNEETNSAGDDPLSRRSDDFNISSNKKVSNRFYDPNPLTAHAKWYIESDRAKKYAPNMSVKPEKYKCGATMEEDSMLSNNAIEKNIQKSEGNENIKLNKNKDENNAPKSEDGNRSKVQQKNSRLQEFFRNSNFKTSSASLHNYTKNKKLDPKTENEQGIYNVSEELKQTIEEFFKSENFKTSSASFNYFKVKDISTLEPIKENAETQTTFSNQSSRKSNGFVSLQNSECMSEKCSNTSILNKSKICGHDEICEVTNFRQKYFFECHSAESKLKKRVSALRDPNHKCSYRFYLNERLFPVPLCSDHENTMRCSDCYLPVDFNKTSTGKRDEFQGNKILNGTLQAKICFGAENELKDIILLLPVKDNILVTEKNRNIEHNEDENVLQFGILKFDTKRSTLAKYVVPENSFALRYQKGYKEFKENKNVSYAGVHEGDVIIL